MQGGWIDAAPWIREDSADAQIGGRKRGWKKWEKETPADHILLRCWGISFPLFTTPPFSSYLRFSLTPLKSHCNVIFPPSFSSLTPSYYLRLQSSLLYSLVFSSPPSLLSVHQPNVTLSRRVSSLETGRTGDDSRAFRLRWNQKVFSPAQTRCSQCLSCRQQEVKCCIILSAT